MPVLRGTVETFDEAAGLGAVRGGDGSVYLFHCTQVADGTRSIPLGVDVVFQVVPGHRGRWEAASIQRC
jgi:CspA family cold shock protein